MSALTYEGILELFAENSRQSKELIDYSLAQVSVELNRVTKELGRKIGELGDTLGRFAEEQVKADVVSKFEKWGIPIHEYGTHFVKKDEKGNFIYEVDILIYNTEYVIALEVKSQLKRDHIDAHIERMQKLQEFPLLGTKGKILLAGMASMIVNDELSKYAESKGLFVIKPNGESVKIANNKKTFKPREWSVN